MTRWFNRIPVCSLAVVALVLGSTVGISAGQAESKAPHVMTTTPLDVAELFLELNDTDGDLGIHGSIDGGPWTSVQIEGPGDRDLLDIVSQGRQRTQGMVQLSFESAEPSFDELAPADFFRRFPEGRYEIEGVAQDGSTLRSTVMLSHVLAAPPSNIEVSGMDASEDCELNVPLVSTPVIISWDRVTRSHPEIGRRGRITVDHYELFVENEDVSLNVELPPDVTEFEVPEGVTDLGGQFKFEIIVRTTTGNNTAVESCFAVR